MLVFGTRSAGPISYVPRAGVAWIGGAWTTVGGGDHPWKREVVAGEPGGGGARAIGPRQFINRGGVEGRSRASGVGSRTSRVRS